MGSSGECRPEEEDRERCLVHGSDPSGVPPSTAGSSKETFLPGPGGPGAGQRSGVSPGLKGSPPGTSPHAGTVPAPLKNLENARIAKRGIFRKPRKTPGFHRGWIRGRIARPGQIQPSQDLGEFSIKIFRWTKGRTNEKDARKTPSTGLRRALYAPRFEPGSGNGAWDMSILPAERGGLRRRRIPRPGQDLRDRPGEAGHRNAGIFF
jgi:hypothetical protein